VIEEVDEAVRSLIRHEALNGAAVEVVFDAPTKEWSARRNSPALDVYLYDIREDMRRREVGRFDVHDDAGRVTGRRRPPRWFKLSYLVTAWTQRPEDEHRLLSAVLACFARHDSLPADVLPVALADQGLPVAVTVALPPPEDRALSDVWSALGGELKPSLDLVITFPLDAATFQPAATLVTEQPRISVGSADGGISEPRQGPRRRGAAAKDGAASAETTGAASGTGAGGGAGPAPAGAGGREEAEAPAGIDEQVTGGSPGSPGRVYRFRTIDDR